jgi:hypothetical protein
VIIDVSGPGAVPPATYNAPFNFSETQQPQLQPPPSNFTVVFRLADLADELQHATATFRPHQDSWTTPLPTPFRDSDIDASESSDGEEVVTTQDLRPDRPVVVYFAIRDIRRGVRILDVVPSLSALSGNEVCKISSSEGGDSSSPTADGKNGDHTELFGISAEVRNGIRMSFLYFTGDNVSLGVYRTEITCETATDAGGDINEVDLTSESKTFVLKVEVHVH